MLRWPYLALSALLALLLLALPAQAAEEILNFNSRIEVAGDGNLRVTETIRVVAEGRAIRRGIFRDFPMVFETPEGREVQVSFDVRSVTRDGQSEDFHIEKASRSARLYIGNANRLIDKGVHTYTIMYDTDRQIRFFETHDELYWNVTGNFWDFPINVAQAEILLPDGVRAEDATWFTGAFGAKDKNASARFGSSRNSVSFSTTRPLAAREGMTIAVKMAKGSIARPSTSQEAAWYLRDNLSSIAAIGSFLVLLLYYFKAWQRVGRDPPAGVIVPRWDAPDGISPAQVHYIENKGLSGNGALSAALLNLAVKGYVKLEELGR